MTVSGLGKRLREVRKNSGYTQKEFGALLDIPQTTLSAYETDRMQPTLASLITIAAKFDVSLDWLCGIEPKIPIPGDLSAALIDAEKSLQELEARRKNESREMKKLRKALLTAKIAAKQKGRDGE